MRIIHEAFKDILLDVKGSTFISGVYQGPLKMRKTNNPYLGTLTTYKFTGALNWVYEKLVEKKIEAVTGMQTVFTPAPRSWGQHLMVGDRFTCVVEHKGKYYMHVTLRATGRKFYHLHGRAIAASVLAPFIENPPVFVKSQGLSYSDSIKPRDFSFENLRSIRLKGVTYELIN